MRFSALAMGPVLAGCALVAVTSCSTDEPQTEAGLAPTMSPAVAAVSAYDIVKVPSMTIDGNLSEWANIAEISMADNSGRPGSGVDNTAKVKLAWDNTYLYAAYNVADTELLAAQTARDHGDIYQDDAIELYLDPQGDGSAASSMTDTDYQFLANVRDALGDLRGNGTGGKDASFNASSFLAKAVTNGTLNAGGADVGYTVELRISWSDLGVTPAAGHFMRIDPAVGDRDGSGPPPTQQFDWAGLTNFNNPSDWKDVQLVNPPPPVSAYDIVKISGTGIAVDGDLSDWANVAEISMADNSGRTGGVDNTAKVKLAWNDTYLYAAYNVTDTELLALQTAPDHGDIFKDDEVELYLDPQGDGASATSMTATDYQLLANVRDAMGDSKGNGTGGKDASYNPVSFLAKAVTNGTLNATGTDVGYTVELRISWSDLGVTPAAGHFMRIDPAVGDRDGSGPPPTQQFDWAGLTNFNNPSGWKSVKLTVDESAPTAPTNLALAVVSSSRIDVSWTASSSTDVAGYKIYRSTTGTPTLLTSVSESPYQDSILTAGTTYTYQVSAVDAAGNESPKTATRSATTTQSSQAGIPYGLWALNADTLPSGTIWTGGTKAGRTKAAVMQQLIAAEVKSPRLGMWFTMSGPDERVFRTNPPSDSSFNLQAWKDTIDANHGGQIQSDGTSEFYEEYLDYIEDGTFQGIIMIDDLAGFEPDVSFADIEAMAAHIHKRFPLLTTAVRQRATVLETQSGGEPHMKLDAAWAQYRSDHGSASGFRDDNIASARRLGIGLVLGMNINQGYFPYPKAKKPMPLDSILVWGNQLLAPGASDYACGFFMWSSTFDGLDSPVFRTLADKAKNRIAAPCKQ